MSFINPLAVPQGNDVKIITARRTKAPATGG
jgi:hypothetical protein